MKIQYILGLSLLCGSFSACDSSSSSKTPPTVTPVAPVPTPIATGTEAASDSNPVLPGEVTTPVSGEFGLRPGLSLTKAQFLTNLGAGIAGRTTEFRKASEALDTAANTYCASYNPAQLDELKLRFNEAMIVWQNLEMFQMGPLAENANTLKYKIYGWPQLSNYCKIDEEAMAAVADPEYGLPSNTNRKGLQALEYLIHDASLVSICPASNPTKAEWEALAIDQKWQARCAYMRPVAAELKANAQSLETLWGSAEDNVVSRKINDAVSAQSVVQELFNNLFYLDLEVKNQKLAAPAGQDLKYCNKTPSPCPDKEELRYSHLSKEALAANIRALADIVFGFGEPRTGGLSALIRGENAPVIADHTERQVAGLMAFSEKEKGSFEVLIAAKGSEDCEASQNSWLCQMRQSIRSVVADFKDEYATVLKTQVPQAPQGDND